MEKKTKVPHCRGTIPIIQSKNRRNLRGVIDIPNTHVHDRSLSWLGTDTSIKSGRVK